MSNFRFMYVIFLFFVIGSCSPGRKLQKEKASDLKNILKEKMSADRNTDYSLEEIRLNVQGDFDISGNGKLYIKRNKFIYLAVQSFGIEVGRAMVTRDSIFYINRLEGKYLFLSMKDLQKKYTKRFDYFLIQNFLVKGIILPGGVNVKHLERFITKDNGNFTFFIGNNGQELLLKYDELFLLKNIKISDENSKILINSGLNYTNKDIYNIDVEGKIGNNKIKMKITPGPVKNNFIVQPAMKINNRYSEIKF